MVARGNRENELQFELKYCERCGGLWLRPVGGGQIYCVGCGREIAQLPPMSKKGEIANVPEGPRWGVDGADVAGHEEDEGVDLDAVGGVS
jgi:hypothetical protein